MKIKKFDKINESSNFDNELDNITDAMYKYTKKKCDVILENQKENIKNLKSELGENYIKKIGIIKYDGHQYHTEGQKYMIEIHFPLYYNDDSGKKWYADRTIKDELKKDEYKQYNINIIDFYGGFNNNMIQLVMI